MTARKTKTPSGISEAGVLYGFDPVDTNRVNALTLGADGSFIVGGSTRLVSASFTRPNDTTIYAVGDLVANSTTNTSVTPMIFSIAKANGGSGSIVRARIRKTSTVTSNASFRIHLYRVAPVTISNGDNGVWLTSNANDYIGAILINVDRAFTDGAAGNGVPIVGSAINFDLSTTNSTNVFGLLEAVGTYTPTAQETFTVSLEVYRD